ncbi:MAG: aminoacyl-tRNA hydrolase [Chloroflexi bacterium]|nr:aminoacyl-tRNA hydrolase [Chloroflexota bacterium]
MEEEVVDKLIVGLGNPGGKYARTRHNVGFMSADAIAHRFSFPSWRRLFKAQVSEGTVAGKRVVLAKPQTFMNLSGEAVRSLLGWYKLDPRHLLAIYDDMDLPLGTIRIRERGSAGGHKGVQSIIQWTKTQEFPRLRIGIARPGREGAADYVLSTFAPDEKPVIEDVISRCVEAVETILSEGIATAMNRYNVAPRPDQEEGPKANRSPDQLRS